MDVGVAVADVEGGTTGLLRDDSFAEAAARLRFTMITVAMTQITKMHPAPAMMMYSFHFGSFVGASDVFVVSVSIAAAP